MFTGIIREIGSVSSIKNSAGLITYSVTAPSHFLSNLQKGASIAVDGICQTVVNFDQTTVWFDAIEETLVRTTIKWMKEGHLVNLERAACIGDEIGGHLLSGHVFGTASILSIENKGSTTVISLQAPAELMKYMFPKGYIALNGASLTIVDVNKEHKTFSIHLIPETLKRTTFQYKKLKDHINIECDTQTQAIVDTVERIYTSKSTS